MQDGWPQWNGRGLFNVVEIAANSSPVSVMRLMDIQNQKERGVEVVNPLDTFGL